MSKSWKTTSAGVITILIAVLNAGINLIQGKPIDFAATIAAVTAGVGLLSAKDSNVTGGTVQQ